MARDKSNGRREFEFGTSSKGYDFRRVRKTRLHRIQSRAGVGAATRFP